MLYLIFNFTELYTNDLYTFLYLCYTCNKIKF